MLPAAREQHWRDTAWAGGWRSMLALERRKFDRTALWNVAVYFGSLLYLGVPLLRTLLICLAVLVSTHLGYGRLWFFRGGVALLIVSAAILTELAPPPAHLQERLVSFLATSGWSSWQLR
jgi:hypothetical protein